MRKRNGVNHEKKVADFSQGAVYAYTIQNEAIHMTALNFGAVITELKTSDRSGNMENVVAAFSDIMDYERQQGPYLKCSRRTGGRKNRLWQLFNGEHRSSAFNQ